MISTQAECRVQHRKIRVVSAKRQLVLLCTNTVINLCIITLYTLYIATTRLCPVTLTAGRESSSVCLHMFSYCA